MNLGLRRRIDEARLAMMLLSRVPMGHLSDPVPSLAAACWAFPLTGLVIGAMGWAVLQLALLVGLTALPAAGLALVTLVLVTGGLHHDGLADLADGLGGGCDRDQRLDIMKDSRIGSFGALALLLCVLLAVASLGAAAETLTLAGFLLVAVTSRLAMLGVLMILPPAQGTGLGHDAAKRSGAAWVPGVLVVSLLALVVGPLSGGVLLAVAVAAGAVALIAYRRIGGQTGDVLGAVQVISECAGWLAVSVVLMR